MGIRIQTVYDGLRSKKVRVSIIDLEYSGVVGTMNLVPNGVVFKTNGDRKDIFMPISTASAKIEFYLDNEDVWSMWNAIIEAEESRFYLQIERYDSGGENGSSPWRREFVGVILIDALRRNDETWPMVGLEASCGLSVLKGVELDIWDTSTFFLAPLWYILWRAIAKNKVIENIYGNSDVVMDMYSNLEVNAAEYAANGNNIFKTVGHAWYMFDREGDAVTPWSAYRVLEEMLKKYMLRLTYDNGRYVIRGVETYLNTGTQNGQAMRVTKAGLVLNGNTVEYENVEIQGLAGGYYTYENGHRQVRIVGSKEGSNKYLANERNFTLANWLDEYYALPTLIKNTSFELKIFMSTTILGPLGNTDYFRDNRIQHCLVFTMKFTNAEDNTVKYGKVNNPTIYSPDSEISVTMVDNVVENRVYIGQYILGSYVANVKFDITEAGFDRKFEFKFKWEFHKDYDPFTLGSNLREYDYISNFSLGAKPLGETGTVSPINAYVPDTKNTERYEVKLYSTDMYGADGTKAWMLSDNGIDRQSTLGWRFSNGDAFEPLEKAMARYMIKYLVNNQEMLTIPASVSDEAISLPRAYGSITYKGNNYNILQLEENYLDAVSLIYAIRKTNATSLPITITALKNNRGVNNSERENTVSDVSLMSRSVNIATVYDIRVVNSQILLIPDGIYIPDPYPTYQSMVQSFLVYVDGVLWNLVDGALNDPSVPPQPKRPRYSIIYPTREIVFQRVLTDSYVKIVWADRYAF